MGIFKRIEFLYWDIHRAVKFGFQRMFRGYSDQDLYNFYDNWIERHLKMLKDFKTSTWGYPMNMDTPEQWDEILDQMISHLELMNEDRVIESLKQGMPEDWEPSYNTVWEIMERHRKDFFELFSKYFYNLWY
jgi:hypothetical protein